MKCPGKVFRLRCLLSALLFRGMLPGQDVLVDQRTHWVAVITDTQVVNRLLNEFYIFEDTVSHVEIIDTNNNGFSTGDILKTYPSEEIYFLDDIGEATQNLMDHWKFQPNYSVTMENRITPEILESRETRKAEYGIVAAFLRGLNRNYHALPLKIWAERDSLGLTFQMWGFAVDSLRYTPPPPQGYDVFQYYQILRDTLFLPDPGRQGDR